MNAAWFCAMMTHRANMDRGVKQRALFYPPHHALVYMYETQDVAFPLPIPPSLETWGRERNGKQVWTWMAWDTETREVRLALCDNLLLSYRELDTISPVAWIVPPSLIEELQGRCNRFSRSFFPSPPLSYTYTVPPLPRPLTGDIPPSPFSIRSIEAWRAINGDPVGFFGKWKRTRKDEWIAAYQTEHTPEDTPGAWLWKQREHRCEAKYTIALQSYHNNLRILHQAREAGIADIPTPIPFSNALRWWLDTCETERIV